MSNVSKTHMKIAIPPLSHRSSMFYNFVKAVLVRNPKKRPSAAKMLSVSTVHCCFIMSLRVEYHILLMKACISSVCVSLQNVFLTQPGLTQELTLDLLEKFRNPEKLKTNLVTEDEEMEVDLPVASNISSCYLAHYHLMGQRLELILTELAVCLVTVERWPCLVLWRGSSPSTNTTRLEGQTQTSAVRKSQKPKRSHEVIQIGRADFLQVHVCVCISVEQIYTQRPVRTESPSTTVRCSQLHKDTVFMQYMQDK